MGKRLWDNYNAPSFRESKNDCNLMRQNNNYNNGLR